MKKKFSPLHLFVESLNENIICAPKNTFFWCTIKVLFFLTSLYCSHFTYCSFNFAIAKECGLNLFVSFFCIGFVHSFMASFLYCSQYSYRSSNYHDICRTFSLLNAIAKSILLSLST